MCVVCVVVVCGGGMGGLRGGMGGREARTEEEESTCRNSLMMSLLDSCIPSLVTERGLLVGGGTLVEGAAATAGADCTTHPTVPSAGGVALAACCAF